MVSIQLPSRRTRLAASDKISIHASFLVPLLLGCGITVLNVMFLPKHKNLSFHVMATWSVMCGFALIVEQSKIYRASSIPQAGRVAELAGVAFIGMGVLLAVATSSDKITLLADSVVWVSLLFNGCFSIAAGPCRLTPANRRERILVPLNTTLVTWAGMTMIYGMYQRLYK